MTTTNKFLTTIQNGSYGFTSGQDSSSEGRWEGEEGGWLALFSALASSLNATPASSVDDAGRPLYRLVIVGMLLTIIAVVTVVGNVVVMIAVVREPCLRATVTNYFIVSLAVADFIIGSIVMPFSISVEITVDQRWLFGPVWCDVWHSVDVLASTASILNLSVIALDRYWAITDPIAYPRRMSTRRAVLLILLVWLCSFAISFPAIAWWRAVTPSLPTVLVPVEGGGVEWAIDDGVCYFTDDSAYLIFSSLISFYIPVSIILFAYYRIYRAAREQIESVNRGVKIMSSSSCSGGSASAPFSSKMPGGRGGGINRDQVTLRIHRGGGGTFKESGGSGGRRDTRERSSGSGEGGRGGGRREEGQGVEGGGDGGGMGRGEHNAAGGIIESRGGEEERREERGEEEEEGVGWGRRRCRNAFRMERVFRRVSTKPASSPASNGTLPINSITTTPPIWNQSARGSEHQINPVCPDESIPELLPEESTQSSRPETSSSSSLPLLAPPVESFTALPSSSYPSISWLASLTLPSPRRNTLSSSPSRPAPLRRAYTRGLGARRSLGKVARERKAAKTLGIVMGVFCLCWVPFFVTNLLQAICGHLDCVRNADILFPVFAWFGYLNSGVNPIIYACSMREFRRAFLRVLCAPCLKGGGVMGGMGGGGGSRLWRRCAGGWFGGGAVEDEEGRRRAALRFTLTCESSRRWRGWGDGAGGGGQPINTV